MSEQFAQIQIHKRILQRQELRYIDKFNMKFLKQESTQIVPQNKLTRKLRTNEDIV